MTKRTYVCNVCRGEFVPDKADKEIIGFTFQAANQISQTRCVLAENHVCNFCLEAMHYLYKETKGTPSK